MIFLPSPHRLKRFRGRGFAPFWFFIALTGASLFPLARAEETTHLPTTCYLFSYFVSPGNDGLHLAWSRDGLKWSTLGGGKSYLVSTVGSTIMRDPSLMLGPDHLFRLVWTDPKTPLQIGYASSPDLINWSSQSDPTLMAAYPTARNCWAPVVDYDKVNRCYQIIWASTVPGMFPATDNQTESGFNHRIFACTTTDFVTFTPATLFYNPTFCSIDATILPAKNRFYLIFKNETWVPATRKNLWIASSENLRGPYGNSTPIPTNPPAWVEGPTALKIGGSYIVYYDCYRAGHMGAVRSKNLHDWKDISAQLVMPPGVRHGSVLAVPSSVIARLLN